MSNILEVKNLRIKKGKEEIIKDISFKVKKGEIFTILGPNGAGKTTLLKALLDCIDYQGKIKWNISRKEISYLPQRLSRKEFKKYPISVKEFFYLKTKKDEEIIETLNLVGLNENIIKKNPFQLSSGQFQKLLIAWGVVGNPKVLLFDEPTTSVDIKGQETIYSLLHRFWKEKNLTIFLVTHDLNVVYGYSDTVLCVNKRKICSGAPKEILTPDLLKELYGTKVKFYKHER
ncbi:MAG: metal ABC transporter ATP-binding protein [Minisyncoccales bacterium]